MTTGERVRVSLIFINNGEILLIQRLKNGQEYYVLPGGGVESGEDLESAALREAEEETGYNISGLKKLWELVNKGQAEHYFMVKNFEGELRLGGPEAERQSEDNVYKLEWVSLQDIKTLNLLPEIAKEHLLNYLTGQGY